MADDKPIIIIKKKGGHGGHHGGAWKVAYADFVTAMMAFFMVMWLINSAETVTKENIASYFRKPGLFDQGSGTPLLIGGAGILDDAFAPAEPQNKKFASGAAQTSKKKKSGDDEQGLKQSNKARGNEKGRGFLPLDVENSAGYNVDTLQKPDTGTLAIQKKTIDAIADQVKRTLFTMPEIKELLGIVDVKIEADGLKIDIMDTDKTSMFASGSATVLPEAQAAFAKIATVIAKIPHTIDIVGHTDSKPFGSRADGYSNWELSSDRANAARKILISDSIKPEQITSVVGRADRELKKPEDPLAASNRRITLKMKIDLQKAIEQGAAEQPKDAIDELFNPTPKVDTAEATGDEHSSAPPTDEESKGTEGTRPKDKQEPVHELTTEEILKGAKENAKEKIILPQQESAPTNPPPKEPEKIFSNSPVLGPGDVVTGF